MKMFIRNTVETGQKIKLPICFFCLADDCNFGCVIVIIGIFHCFRFRCTRCHSSCKECSGEHLHQCLECPRGLVLRADGRCSLTCPPGAFYKDLKEQICKPCHPSCTQCFGPTENECRRCVGKNCLFNKNYDT